MARAHRVAVEVLAVLVLFQAVVAGQSLFGDWSIELHGYLGNGSFALGVVVAVLAVAAHLGRIQIIAAVALSTALFAQVGLGYAGRTVLGAASLHIPMGVAIFGLIIFMMTVATMRGGHEAPN